MFALIAGEEIQVGTKKTRGTSIFSVSIFVAIVFGVGALIFQYMIDKEGVESTVTLSVRSFDMAS